MRPHKQILYWSHKKDREPDGTQAFMIRTMLPVRLSIAHCGVPELGRLVADNYFDLVVILHQSDSRVTTKAATAVRRFGDDTPALIVAIGPDCPTVGNQMHPRGAGNAELLGRIRQLYARKRGPKRGFFKKQVDSEMLPVALGVA